MPPTHSASLVDAVAKVGDRWALLLVNALLSGPRRFNELLEDVDGISPNVLAARLRQLEEEGIVVARPYSRRPPRSDYRLSASGEDLAGVLTLLEHWGSTHHESAGLRHGACGTPLEVRWFCPTCARVVDEPEAADVHMV